MPPLAIATISPNICHSKLKKILQTLFPSNPIHTCNKVIATKFCICSDSCAVGTCAKFCVDHIPGIPVQLNVISIWGENCVWIIISGPDPCLAIYCPQDWPPYIMVTWRNHNFWGICFLTFSLTHWGRATHVCVGKLTIIGSDNGLSPGRRQAIIWTIAGILLIGP